MNILQYKGTDHSAMNGYNIFQTSEILRNFMEVEKYLLKAMSGWFLSTTRYEDKYILGYHVLYHSEHVTLLRERLAEMRGGKPDATIRPALKHLTSEFDNATDETSFYNSVYGVIIPRLIESYEEFLEGCDSSGNANEIRIAQKILVDLKNQKCWFLENKSKGDVLDSWSQYIDNLLQAIGGIQGTETVGDYPDRPHSKKYIRPKTIHFDERIERKELESYESRGSMEPEKATTEQFKVFFNEMYAAALLASILYDSIDGDYPWAMIADFSRHFWDEVRHSEFGAIRLKELGAEPDRCNPILFEESEDLPVLHRIAYLTRGLEAYFMPRKPKRMKEYQDNGDYRSQLYADQDWSDEINHVRYGNTWTNNLLEDDAREVDDIIEEVKQHIYKKTGRFIKDISAPF